MENTSYISDISYQIEKWLYNGYNIESIKEMIIKLQGKGKFPKNLELIDTFLDKSYGYVYVHF